MQLQQTQIQPCKVSLTFANPLLKLMLSTKNERGSEGKHISSPSVTKIEFQHRSTSETGHGAALCQVCFRRTFTQSKVVSVLCFVEGDWLIFSTGLLQDSKLHTH